ncbi:MAG TPA: hypothetical protein VJ505_06620 [Holophagaceae bacterium]|nr:hypothetical protein [Holophagaceae bacterium]
MNPLQDILQQVLQLPGVVGALTYDARGTVTASSFPKPYDPGELQRVSRLLSEDFMVQQALEGAKGGLDLRYAGGRVILRPFSRGSILALCAATANAQLVNLGLVQAIHRLEKAEPDLTLKAKPQEPRLPRVEAEAVRPLVLEALKEAFLLRIGPIGGLLFNRLQAKWLADAEAKAQGAYGLASLLAREIDDPEDQKAFIHDARYITG